MDRNPIIDGRNSSTRSSRKPAQNNRNRKRKPEKLNTLPAKCLPRRGYILKNPRKNMIAGIVVTTDNLELIFLTVGGLLGG